MVLRSSYLILNKHLLAPKTGFPVDSLQFSGVKLRKGNLVFFFTWHEFFRAGQKLEVLYNAVLSPMCQVQKIQRLEWVWWVQETVRRPVWLKRTEQGRSGRRGEESEEGPELGGSWVPLLGVWIYFECVKNHSKVLILSHVLMWTVFLKDSGCCVENRLQAGRNASRGCQVWRWTLSEMAAAYTTMLKHRRLRIGWTQATR